MKKGISIIFVMLVAIYSYGEESNLSFDFVMQDIQDIVYAVSIAQGVSIVCDDTVSGKTSFRFSGTDFKTAGESFLRANRLYARKEGEIIVLSKVDITYHAISDTYTINAYDISPSVLFNKISEYAQIPISYELLPSILVSLHVKNIKLEEAISIVMKSFSDYAVNVADNSIHIVKTAFSQNSSASLFSKNSGTVSIDLVNNVYDINIMHGSFFESLETLFALSNLPFCNLVGSDRLITRLVSSGKNFDETLSLLCYQAEAGFTYHDGMYVLFGLENASNTLIYANSFWKTITLSFMHTETFASLFQKRFQNMDFLIISDTTMQVKTSSKEESEVDAFIVMCDTPSKVHLIELQYITSEKLLLHLPSGIAASQFVDLGTGYSLFFSGSNDAYQKLAEAIKEIDKPATIIRYDLLVLQVQESDSFNWNPSFSVDSVSLGDRTKLSGHIGSILALNVDIVSIFGYTFAAELQSAISKSKAEVYVDTQLQGISGSPIHFQNTNTFRYQDTAINPDTGKPVYSGITREIIAGLVLSIEGWVSGDGMITTKVTASLSRRGADVSDNGNPPPTSEKVVTTEVRGKSGEPIVLSGLVQNDATFVEEKTPFLSSIPLVGWLFESKNTHEEKTEMIIYLVPHVHSEHKGADNDI